MATHISHASLPFPVKNARYTVLVPYLDADGDPTDPTTPDSEVSQDGGTFADAAEEVTTITGSNGLGFITFSGAEMNNSAVGVAFKVASGPKATLMTLYPRVLPILESGTAQAGAAGTITLASGAAAYDLAGCIVRTTGGTGGGGTGGANNQARVITAYNTSTKVATVVPNWETTPDATTTYDVLYTDLSVNPLKALQPTTLGRTLVVDAAGLADANAVKVGPTGAGTAQTAGDIPARLPAALTANGNMKSSLMEILATALTETSGLLAAAFKKFFNVATPTGTVNSIPDAVAGAAGGLFIAGSNAAVTANITGNLTGNVSGSVGSVTGAVGSVAAGGIAAASFAAGAIDAAALAANAIGASELATDAVTEINAAVLAVLPTALTAGGYMKSDVLAINGNVDSPVCLDRSARAIVRGTVGAASTTTSIVTSSLSPAASVTDQFKGRVVIFDLNTTTAALRGQATDITASTAGGVLTVTALTTAPASGDTFAIV